MTPLVEIDISENRLRRKGKLLDRLLMDHSTGKNILWGTDSYASQGKEFAPNKEIAPDLVTGIYGKLIQPRAVKSRDEQRRRTKEKGEVFTPLKTVDQMNKQIDWAGIYKKYIAGEVSWQEYVSELKLEITCGEAPFIVSRYNPVARGALLKLESRVGFLDRKLHIVSQYCGTQKQWIEWAKIAYQSSYGYEWQGDNLLIARENLLYTLIDYYKDKFGRVPSLTVQQEFADIIGWNMFQMDGIRYVVPMSCRHETRTIAGDLTLFRQEPDVVEKYECEGCKFNRPAKHNGKYAKVMDWTAGKQVRFVDLAE